MQPVWHVSTKKKRILNLFSAVQFSDYFTGYFNGQYWLWWIFLLLGEFVAVEFSTCAILLISLIRILTQNSHLSDSQVSCCSSGVLLTTLKSATCQKTWPPLTEHAFSFSTKGKRKICCKSTTGTSHNSAVCCNDLLWFLTDFHPVAIPFQCEIPSSPLEWPDREALQWREGTGKEWSREVRRSVTHLIKSLTQFNSEVTASEASCKIPLMLTSTPWLCFFISLWFDALHSHTGLRVMSRSAVDKLHHGVKTDVLDIGSYSEIQNESTMKLCVENTSK